MVPTYSRGVGGTDPQKYTQCLSYDTDNHPIFPKFPSSFWREGFHNKDDWPFDGFEVEIST